MDIIFDLCGVILEWKPEQVIGRFFDDPEVKKVVKEGILGHPDWVELDKGTLARGDAIRRAHARTGVPIDAIDKLIAYIPRSLIPVPEAVQLVQDVKAKGHRLFLLTNIPIFSLEYVENAYPFFTLFDGIVASCRVNLVKPEPEIYHHLLGRYGLTNRSTVFIDDSASNIHTAAGLGIPSILFESPQQCVTELVRIGCL